MRGRDGSQGRSVRYLAASTGIGKNVGSRLYPELELALWACEEAHPDKPSRPELIRQLLTEVT